MAFFRNKRLILNILALCLFCAILFRLVKLQVVMGNEYRVQSENRLVSQETIEAPRGIMMDRNGKPLVTNKQGFAVEMYKSGISYDELNDIILKLTALFDRAGEKYADTLPIEKDSRDFKFASYEGDERNQKISEFKVSVKAAENASAKDCVNVLADKYEIAGRYSDSELRTIVGVRYEMENRGFGSGTPFTIASDVSLATVSEIEENSDTFKNVGVVTRPVREYAYPGVASHLLGRVGIIYREEYEALKDSNYGLNDMIGKDGLEKSLEKYLKGTNGVRSTLQTVSDKDGKTSDVPALAGNNVVLTIDIDLQQTAEQALRDTIAQIRAKGVEKKNRAGADAGGGAVVVTDVNTGDILAMASYPTYDIVRFDDDYDKLLSNKLNPMFNRAISGVYAPGSVFKILTAIAGLEEKVITKNEVIEDKGVYEYYDQKFNCWIWTDTHTTHGRMTVETAIQNSCNYYFYEVGKRLGYEKMYNHAKEFGLGELTGIELDGESKGVLANAEYKKLNFNTPWYPGDNLQMAIGQSYNLFTPVQISNYIATVANGGTRYKPRLTKNVRNIYSGESVVTEEPTVLNKVTMSPETQQTVTHGMRLVSDRDGTASIFADFPIEVCSKTGSAQVAKGSANGVFASYAPYKNPQISVAIVVENAGSGAALAPIAKTIYEKYFDLFGENEPPDKDAEVKNALIK